MEYEKQRIHARIQVATKIEVTTAVGNQEAQLRDLSKGGACFTCKVPVGDIGDTIELFLPSLKDEEITVMAEIVRVRTDAEGQTVAVRFAVVDPAMRRAMQDLIEMLLSATGGGQRATPRVARRMDIHYGQIPELRAILDDISHGGLAMLVAEPLALFEELEVTVPDTSGAQLLILRAGVVHQRAVDYEGQTLYRVGLEFGPMRAETRRCLNDLLKTVMESVGA